MLSRSEDADARYENLDNDQRGPWTSGDLLARNFYGKGTYEVTSPRGKQYSNPKGSYWRVSKENFDDLNSDGRIWWGSDGNNMPRLKRFLSEVKQGVVPQTLWKYGDVGHTQEAKKELLEYVDFANTENVLNSVKPTRLLRRAIQIGTRVLTGDIVLDFFAGSASLGHAVILQNAEDGENRKFILVQLPEPLPIEEPKVKTIADHGKSRLRRVAEKIRASGENQLVLDARNFPDTGFKLMKLDRSNFKVWEGDLTIADGLEHQIKMQVDHLSHASGPEDILYELLLKAGFSATTKISIIIMTGKQVFSIEDGSLLICLEAEITPELIDALADANPLQVICLDQSFKGNDQLKANAVQTFKARSETMNPKSCLGRSDLSRYETQIRSGSSISARCDRRGRLRVRRTAIRIRRERWRSSRFKSGGLFQTELGMGNRLMLPDQEIFKNVHAIRGTNDIEKVASFQGREFSIEMETGTGKTYVYLRTIFGLNKAYGFRKFIIVVPSVAVREGVLKSIDIMKEHFADTL